jgi:hypothetical protein
MVLALDGVGYTAGASGTTCAITLTTTSTNDVIIVFAAVNSTTTASIADTAGLTWALRQRVVGGSDCIEEWWAISAGVLSADTITLTLSATSSFVSASAHGISGANTSNPFDQNASLPGTNAAGIVAISTSSRNTFIVSAYRMAANQNPLAGQGYTQIAGNTGNGYFGSQYLIANAQQDNLRAVFCGSDVNGGIADAIVAEPPTGAPQEVVYLTTASASTQQWAPPGNCATIDKIELWGGGGSGAYENGARATGGGAGAYTFINGPIAVSSIVTAGTVPYVVGPGGANVFAATGVGINGTDTWFVAAGTYKAVAGGGGKTAASGTAAGGTAGAAASCIPSGNAVNGGAGGTCSSTGGASGGGSSGTPSGAGVSAAAVTTAVAGTGVGPVPGSIGGNPDASGGGGLNGGSGGGGSKVANVSGNGGAPGGGSGAYNFSTAGIGTGTGGNGQIRITYTPITPYQPLPQRGPILAQ